MHQQLLAHSASGRPILTHSSWSPEQTAPGPVVVFIGGVHGDEPEGILLAKKTLSWLKTQPPETLRPWVLIECLNVDGFEKGTRTNARGVDLNRNFPSQDWSSEHKAERYYPGPFPGSEPEVQGLIRSLQKTPASLIVHAHSWNPCVVLTGATPTPEISKFSEDCGYQLTSDIGYPTPGSLGSYGWNVLKTPVLCIEEQEGASPEETWTRFKPAIPWLFWTRETALSQGLQI